MKNKILKKIEHRHLKHSSPLPVIFQSPSLVFQKFGGYVMCDVVNQQSWSEKPYFMRENHILTQLKFNPFKKIYKVLVLLYCEPWN